MSDYFGQSPDGYQKPLYGASNLSDVVNKPLALTNLGAASADDVLKAANPIGTIISFYGSVAPYGYLPCSGQSVSSATFPSLVTFLGGTTSATLPDLRGEFLRGWDNGRGIDTGRAIRTLQLDAFQGHFHDITGSPPGGDAASGSAQNTLQGTDGVTMSGEKVIGPKTDGINGTPRIAVETRPRNISVLYCIKAYDTPVSAGTLNVGALASEMALKTALTDFTGTNQSFAANGYQKLPGGMIIQWGKNSGASSGNNIVTFPIAFPNSCLFTMASTDGESGVSETSRQPLTNGKTTTTATFYVGQTETNGAAAGSFNWFATGY